MDSADSVEIPPEYSWAIGIVEEKVQKVRADMDIMNGDYEPGDFDYEGDYDYDTTSFDIISEDFESAVLRSQDEASKMSIDDEEDGVLLLGNVQEVDYETREYQAELFRKSRKKNSIIILETGSGKTIISLLNILDAIKTHGNKKKVAYLSCEVNLVEQQTKKIRAFLRKMQFMEEYAFLRENQPRVICLHGKRGDDAWRYVFGDINDSIPIILVITPQYFLNGLRRGYVKMDEFSLVVFDECHHCSKGHPYNILMQEFYHRSSPNTSNFKPQILGLTATPIAANDKMNLQEIENSLLQMCMNLDSTFCTLEDVDFGIVSGVQKSEAKIRMWPYDQDSRLNNVDVLVEADHRKMTLTFTGLEVLVNNWNHAMIRIVQYFERGQAKMYLSAKTRMTIDEYFRSKITNRAIALYFELGPYAVYLYFLDIYTRLEALLEDFGFTKLDRKKIEYVKGLLAEFLEHIKDYNDKDKLSDKFYSLLKLLDEVYSKNPQSTGIIFVVRKYLAKMLNKILQVKAPNYVKSEYIIGHDYFGLTPVPEDKDKEKEEQKLDFNHVDKPQWEGDGEVKKEGKHFRKLFNPRLTLQGQLKTINKFKEGQFNLLIATSLVQEGFDVSDCNFVVSFRAPKTALTTVQIRGRARKPNSEYYILVPRGLIDEKGKEIQRNIDMMENIKLVARQFEKNLPTRANNGLESNGQGQGQVQEEENKCGGYVSVNWCEWLTRIFCTSMPSNSLEIHKPFYLLLERQGSKTEYRCIVLLPNQSKVRITVGDICGNRGDAKKNAALKCCQKLIKIDCFEYNLDPKSLNKDSSELEGLKMDLLSERLNPQFIKRLDRLYLRSHTFSHFGKRFEFLKQKGKYCGYMYEIKLTSPGKYSEKSSLKISLVHNSKSLDGFIFDKAADNLTVRLVFEREVYFTAREYKNFLLTHRYLVSFANSTLVQFYSNLTDDPPSSGGGKENRLDFEYEVWSSHKPSLSFFAVVDEKLNISEKFQTDIRAYILYQSKIYQYFNSLNYDQEGQLNSLWDRPSPEYSYKASQAGYVLQDIWKFNGYRLESVQNLNEIDFCSSSDGYSSLQLRSILLGRFLHGNIESNYGIEVTEIKNKERSKIFFDEELMVSPLPIGLYEQLSAIVRAFKIFPQAKLSLRQFTAILDGLKNQEIDEKKSLTCKIDVKDMITAFDYFEEQASKQVHLFSQPNMPGLNEEKCKPDEFSRADTELDEIESELENIFMIEKNYKGDISSIQDSPLELLGDKLISLLMSCEIFFENPQEWDYSLEKIKKKKIVDWKEGNSFINEILELFVSQQGNKLLCEAILEDIDKDQNKLCSEYLARATFSKIIKNAAYMLYDKENGSFDRVQIFLNTVKLLAHQSINLRVDMSLTNKDQSRKVLADLYNRKYKVLEQVIGHTFQHRYLIIDALMEISFRDYYIKWMEKDGFILQSILEKRKEALEKNKEEILLPNSGQFLNSPLLPHVEDTINNFHRNPNDLDRFKWLGQSLLEFMVLEWVYDMFKDKMTELELTMHAKFFASDQFIAYVSWAYHLEDYMIGHQSCYEQIKMTKQKIGQKDLLRLDLLKDKETKEVQKICTISSNLLYSLIGALFIDCYMDYRLTREKVLALLKPYVMDYINSGLSEEYAPLKLEKICLMKDWKRPEIRKGSLAEKESFIRPESSNYSLHIGEKEVSRAIGASLKTVEYSLYILALEGLENIQ